VRTTVGQTAAAVRRAVAMRREAAARRAVAVQRVVAAASFQSLQKFFEVRRWNIGHTGKNRPMVQTGTFVG
jgi:hypothetical protein